MNDLSEIPLGWRLLNAGEIIPKEYKYDVSVSFADHKSPPRWVEGPSWCAGRVYQKVGWSPIIVPNNMKYKIRCKSAAQTEAVLRYLETLGIRIRTGSVSENSHAADAAIAYFNKGYPNIYIDLENKRGGCYNDYEFNNHSSAKLYTEIDFNTLFTLGVPKVVKIQLNNEYVAEVSKDGIKVGCQTFPLDVIDKLVEARKSLDSVVKND